MSVSELHDMHSKQIKNNWLRAIAYVFFLGATAEFAVAQQQAPSTVAENTESEITTTTTTKTTPSPKDDTTGTVPESKETQRQSSFTPTEKIRAGDAVSFPADI